MNVQQNTKYTPKKPIYTILIDWTCEFITEYQTMKKQILLICSKN